ncbi:MAG: pirin family protein [Zoogloeaceae bacterium]|jgi:redox-sensitive bicupin YhaK (pirin superfamily)|nr:pirin family protein [Zoogloeaceae bacterium]
MTNHYYRKKAAAILHYLPASDMHPADTYFHFSFAHYYDPENMNYGVLRVINDDDVKPASGFDVHGHRDMEIVSYLIHGHLTHWDSATNQEQALERGHVQIITAGAGVLHSELNRHDDRCRFLQIWILPPAKNLPVRYEHHRFTDAERQNRLLHIVGSLGHKDEAPLRLNQDVNLYTSELTDANAEVRFELQAGRQAYINNFEGVVSIEGLPTLETRDSLEINGPAALKFRAWDGHAHFIIVEMPASED